MYKGLKNKERSSANRASPLDRCENIAHLSRTGQSVYCARDPCSWSGSLSVAKPADNEDTFKWGKRNNRGRGNYVRSKKSRLTKSNDAKKYLATSLASSIGITLSKLIWYWVFARRHSITRDLYWRIENFDLRSASRNLGCRNSCHCSMFFWKCRSLRQIFADSTDFFSVPFRRASIVWTTAAGITQLFLHSCSTRAPTYSQVSPGQPDN